MRIDVTVRSGECDRDLALVTATPVAFAEVAAEIARVIGVADSGWWSGDECVLPAQLLGTSGLRPGSVLTTGGPVPGSAHPGLVTLRQIGGPQAGRVLPLERGRVLLGRGADCEVPLTDPDASRRHALIEVSGTTMRLRDLGSTNGTWVDDLAVGPRGVALSTGARIRIGDSTFELVGPIETPAAYSNARDGTRRIVRPPRQPPPLAATEIELPVEASSSRPRGIQWVTALLPAAAGGLIAWVLRAPQFLLFALLSPVMMLSSSVGDRLHWRRSRRRAAADFGCRRAAAEQAVAAGLRAETVSRRAGAPDPAAIMRTCALPGSRLWERRTSDPDFLRLRIGAGDMVSTLLTRAGTATAAAGTLRDVPVCVDVRAGPVGLTGPRHVTAGIARWLMCQAAALHSPVDVSITLLLTRDAAARWQWTRWLPHLADAATDSDAAASAVAELSALIEQRRRRGRGGSWDGAWHIVIADSAHELADVPGLAALLTSGSRVGVTGICVDEDESALPAACRSVVRVSGDTGTRARVRHGTGTTDAGVVIDDVTPSWADTLARQLTPTVDAGGSGIGTLPDSCRLLDLLDIDDDDAGAGAGAEQRLVKRWACVSARVDTPLGIAPDGPLHLDLVADGPHLLIAGTTGAGKSELLQTLVAGLAARHPPDLLTFLLVDYKGGAAFADCARLPHAVGLVTDLDPHLTARALRSLDCELRRRERLFAIAGVADLAAYRDVSGAEPIARLAIVVDEFATLAEELPDFVRGLVGVAQRGRSLGVHLVLATQRPGGAVSAEIRANTTARIALRVTDPGESSDVIDAADASSIDRARPGRAYLRTGSSLVCFQTARASAPPDAGPRTTVEPLGPWRRRPHRVDAAAGPTDLTRLVDLVIAAAAKSGRAPARAPWVPPLPEQVAQAAVESSPRPTMVPYALVDLPDEQRRDVARLDLAAGSSLLAVGAARTGRTGLLSTIALGAVARLTPAQLHVYVVDPAGDLAAVIGSLPHCATVIGRDDLAIVPTLLRRLESVVGRGVDRSDGSTPTSLLLADNWESVCATLPDTDAISCADALTALQRSGPASGLSIVVTGDRTALAPRFAAGFDERLLLRLADRNDYGMVGIAVRDAPTTMPPGRALRGSDGAIMQISFAVAEPGRDGARGRVVDLATAGPDHGIDVLSTTTPGARDPVRLRALPRSVALGALPLHLGQVTLGLGGDAAQPVSIDLFAGAARLLVAGPPRSGRSTVLQAILAQAIRLSMDVVVGAGARSPLRRMADAYGVRVVDPAAPADGVGPAPQTRTLLLVDDCERYADEPAGEALTSWLRDPGAALAAVVAGRTEDLATSYRGLGAQVRRTNCGLLLRPGPLDGELLGVRLPRRPSCGPPGRGVLVGDPQWGPLFEDGEPVPLQAARP